MRSPRKNIRVREKMLESEKIFFIPIGVRRSLSELRWTSLDSVGTPLDSVGTVKLSDVILYFSESMNCEEYLEIVRWSPSDIRWSPTESDGRPSESVGVRRISDGIPSDSKQIEQFRNFGVRSESSSIRSESVGLENES